MVGTENVGGVLKGLGFLFFLIRRRINENNKHGFTGRSLPCSVEDVYVGDEGGGGRGGLEYVAYIWTQTDMFFCSYNTTKCV